MADDAQLGKRLLRTILALHLIVFGVMLVMKEQITEVGLFFQLTIWVIIPILLVQQIERGSAIAIFLFAVILALGAAVGILAAYLWAHMSDMRMYAATAAIAVGYIVATAVVSFSPAVRSLATIARYKRSKRQFEKMMSNGRTDATQN